MTMIVLSCATPAKSNAKSNENKLITIHSRTNVYIPKDYSLQLPEEKKFHMDDINIDVYARKFAQGNAVYAEIYKAERLKNKTLVIKNILFNKRKVFITEKSWGMRCLFAIQPDEVPGDKKFVIDYSIDGKKNNLSLTIKILKTEFPFYKHPLDLGKYSNVESQLKPETIAFIKECAEKKRIAFNSISQDHIENVLSHPRNSHHITSPFWSKRIYMLYKIRKGKKIKLKNKINVHSGLDFRGNFGTPIYTMADGVVVLAENMYYEGNFIIIDHGNSVFSYYMHLSEIKVKKGDIIKGGDLIGLVGSSGISTGAHLHASFIIQGIQVDPLSMLPLPFRN